MPPVHPGTAAQMHHNNHSVRVTSKQPVGGMGQNPASIVDLDIHGQPNEMEGGNRSGAMAGSAAYGLRGAANRRGNS